MVVLVAICVIPSRPSEVTSGSKARQHFLPVGNTQVVINVTPIMPQGGFEQGNRVLKEHEHVPWQIDEVSFENLLYQNLDVIALEVVAVGLVPVFCHLDDLAEVLSALRRLPLNGCGVSFWIRIDPGLRICVGHAVILWIAVTIVDVIDGDDIDLREGGVMKRYGLPILADGRLVADCVTNCLKCFRGLLVHHVFSIVQH